jgi:hypothetical protein
MPNQMPTPHAIAMAIRINAAGVNNARSQVLFESGIRR